MSVADMGDSVDLQLREILAQRLGSARFGLWFGEGVKLGVDGDALRVGVPNAFFREWIQGHFAANLAEAGEAVTGKPLRLAFHIEGEAEPNVGHVIEPTPPEHRKIPKVKIPVNPNPGAEPPPHVEPRPQSPPSTDRPRMHGHPSLRPIRRLDDFVTGPGNRLAQAAAVEMSQTLGTSFNPLVIHGGVGLGKTHLLEGIGHAIRARRPGIRLLHVTAEAFTNSFLDAMRNAALTAFRARFRGSEALLIDDVHFLAAKRATQDEFLHTFNALIAEGVPIVVAADQHPRRIAKLTDEIATRLLGGDGSEAGCA